MRQRERSAKVAAQASHSLVGGTCSFVTVATARLGFGSGAMARRRKLLLLEDGRHNRKQSGCRRRHRHAKRLRQHGTVPIIRR